MLYYIFLAHVSILVVYVSLVPDALSQLQVYSQDISAVALCDLKCIPVWHWFRPTTQRGARQLDAPGWLSKTGWSCWPCWQVMTQFFL